MAFGSYIKLSQNSSNNISTYSAAMLGRCDVAVVSQQLDENEFVEKVEKAGNRVNRWTKFAMRVIRSCVFAR